MNKLFPIAVGLMLVIPSSSSLHAQSPGRSGAQAASSTRSASAADAPARGSSGSKPNALEAVFPALAQAADAAQNQEAPEPPQPQQKAEPSQRQDPFAPTEEMREEAERPQLEQIQDQVETIIEELARQRQLIEQLDSRLDDLSTRLSDIPAMSVKASAVSADRAGAAWLQVADTSHLVREGDTIDLQPGNGGGVLQSIRIVEIGSNGVVVEIGPWREKMVVQ